jgi:hypothetical protein
MSLGTLCWIMTNNLKFIIFVSLINVCTIIFFWSENWQKHPYSGKVVEKPVIIELKEQNPYFSDIEESSIFLGNLKSYRVRRKVLAGIMVRKFDLEPLNDLDTQCIFKGYDYDRNKVFYWNKCNNKISEP